MAVASELAMQSAAVEFLKRAANVVCRGRSHAGLTGTIQITSSHGFRNLDVLR